jgi:5-methyltetrahydrofolate--homocysteine methyltransferase
MPRISLREKIKKDVFFLDGAMGTELIARGFGAGTCNDYLNIESPNIVLDIHQSYLRAGSDAVLTNTFGANKYGLGRHKLTAELEKINAAGAQIARKAAGRERYVLGDIGPIGDFLQPLGALKPNEVKDAFCDQAKALMAGDVDGFIIESMMALDEMSIAIEAVKSISGDLPVFAAMAFSKGGDGFRTMMGVDVESAVSKMISLGVEAVGFNCGTVSLDDYVELAQKYVSIVRNLSAEAAIFAEPNAGKPELINGKAMYKVSPGDFANAMKKIHSAGVNIIGGCCGTSPEHIAAMSKKLRAGNR